MTRPTGVPDFAVVLTARPMVLGDNMRRRRDATELVERAERAERNVSWWPASAPNRNAPVRSGSCTTWSLTASA
jgi:hypothetical protein